MRSYSFRSISFLLLVCLAGCLEPVVLERNEAINEVYHEYKGDLTGTFRMTGEYLKEIGGEGVDATLSADKKQLSVFAIKHYPKGYADVLEMTLRSLTPIVQGQEFTVSSTPDSVKPLSIKTIFNDLYVSTQLNAYYLTLSGTAKINLLTEDSIFGTFKTELFNGAVNKLVTIDSGLFSARLNKD